MGARPAKHRDLRWMLGHFATGVTVVTARAPGGYECLTVNSFNSVSLSPPLILFSVHRASSVLAAFEATANVGVNVLGDGHREISSLCAGKERAKWKDSDVRIGANGCLLLNGAIARMECRPWAIHDGGDHRVFICLVESFDYDEAGRPLLFFRGNYHSLAA